VEAVALTKAIFGLKGEELEGKLSTSCESLGPLICETCSAVGLQGGEGLGTNLRTEDPEQEGRNLLKEWAYRPPKGE